MDVGVLLSFCTRYTCCARLARESREMNAVMLPRSRVQQLLRTLSPRRSLSLSLSPSRIPSRNNLVSRAIVLAREKEIEL